MFIIETLTSSLGPIMIKRIQETTLILIAILFIISCDQDKIVHDDSGITIQREQITGFVQKGPFINGTSISMYELNSSMEQTGRAFNTQIHNNQGSFEVNNVELSSPYIELSANGYYYNEISGQVTQSTINLLALSDISDKSTINVNILTHLEKRRVEYLIAQGNSFPEAKKIAQAEVLAIFGIEKSDIASSESLDISIENEDNAILIAISVILQGNRTPGQLTELLANITTDIRDDGILNNQDIHEGLRNSSVNLNLEEIRTNLENRYQELEIGASIPEYEDYVNAFLSFTAQKPSAITKEAIEISDSSATLDATVNPNSSPTSVYFEYGTSTDYGNMVEAKQGQVSGITHLSVSASISELSDSTIYHYRVMAENELGITYGDDMTFMTLSADEPSAITKAATDITDSSATLHATVNPNRFPTSVYFEYGTSTDYGNVVEVKEMQLSGITDVSISAAISELSHSTLYHYRVIAENKVGITYGDDMAFMTLSADKPSAITRTATDITASSARLHGTVNPNYPPTFVYFEYGPTLEFGNIVDAEPSPVSGTDDISVHAYIDGLSENIEYYFRVKAENKIGITYGEVFTFKTFLFSIIEDIDGNKYQTVKIGDQWWMTENLRVTRYRNGNTIPANLDNTGWENTTSGAYAIYPHSLVDGINSDEEMVGAYGQLYNWYAVVDSRGLCPTGWHIPSDEDWKELEIYLGLPEDKLDVGGSRGYDEGGKIKSTQTDPELHPRWDSPNSFATNEFGWSGLPGGLRDQYGSFRLIGIRGSWWSSTIDDQHSMHALARSLAYLSGTLGNLNPDMRVGYSVRCVQD
jgi:uncharacterized protein (TIGR02145 family)